MRALEAASDALYRENPTGAGLSDAERREQSAQRRADGMALVAERALGAGFGTGSGEGSGGSEGEDDSTPIHVARVVIDPISTAEQASDAFRVEEERIEGLSFTPWHHLPEHRPLGHIQRTRKFVYAASARHRGAQNAEPTQHDGE